jgi:hypothetical protein
MRERERGAWSWTWQLLECLGLLSLADEIEERKGGKRMQVEFELFFYPVVSL